MPVILVFIWKLDIAQKVADFDFDSQFLAGDSFHRRFYRFPKVNRAAWQMPKVFVGLDQAFG